jgi:hypothetical protein
MSAVTPKELIRSEDRTDHVSSAKPARSVDDRDDYGTDGDTSDDYDYGTDGEADGAAVAKAFADLDRLTLAAERATVARQAAEDVLQKAKDVERNLLEREIPALMLLMRHDKCTTSSGIEVSVKRDIKASLPGLERIEARMGALRWLIERGHGGVIKNVVTVDLDRGDDARADELVLELRGKGFDPQAKKDVHAGTLSKLARELMSAGTIVPKEYFNLYDLKVAALRRK